MGLTTGCALRGEAGDESPLADIDAGRIVAVADGDHLASTYADGRLAPVTPAYRDVLAVWRPRARPSAYGRVAAPNSVTSPPEVLALSPDGRFAYVAERLGQRSAGIVEATQLPRGGRLTALDLRDPARPRQAASLDLGEGIEALDVRGDGRLLALVSNTADGGRVHLLEVDGARLGAVQSFDLARLGIEGGDAAASAVFWHPSGEAIAVHLYRRDQVAFFRVLDDGRNGLRLRPWGRPVRVGRDPFTGRFTPDGRHYLTLDWGRDFAATTLEGRLPRTPSRISVLRLAEEAGADAWHHVIGGAATDRSSEGIAISPDGRLVATVNMRETALPPDSPRHVREASVSLLSFDPARGALTRLGETRFEGVLPEGASFDRSGRHLLVTVFQYRDAAGGGIEVFRIAGAGDTARAVRVGRLAAPHGVHHVVVAP